MKSVTGTRVLITASGGAGYPKLIRDLRKMGYWILATDIESEVASRFVADQFSIVPKPTWETFSGMLIHLLETNNIDVLYCTSSAEVEAIALNADTLGQHAVIMVSKYNSLKRVIDKGNLYRELQSHGIKAPIFTNPKTLDTFKADLRLFGYPKNDVCFKPAISKGSRGFRILSEKVDRKDLLLNHKPDSKYMTLAEFEEIFEGGEFPKNLLLMSYIDKSQAFDCMALGYKGENLLTTVKTREKEKAGIITHGKLVHSPYHEEACSRIIKLFDLEHNISIQFLGKTVIEINPRPATFIYTDDFNEPHLAIQLALGNITADKVRSYQDKVPYGFKMTRYMDEVFYQ